MRSAYFLSVICVYVLASGLLADDFAGFRIPAHRVYSVDGNFNLQLIDQSSHYPAGQSYSTDSRQTSVNQYGHLSGTGYYLHDSDPWRLRLSLDASTGGLYYKHASESSTGANVPSSSRNEDKNRAMGEDWTVSGDVRGYPWAYPAGFLADLDAAGSYQQSWYRSENDSRSGYVPGYRYLTTHREGLSSYDYQVTADAGFGFGRVRDVSSVYDVYVLQQRLKAQGALARDLSAAAVQKLQELYYFSGEYTKIHDRSAKFYWQEVERILRDDGALTDNTMTAYTIHRIAESYLSSTHSSSFRYSNPSDDFAPGEERGRIYGRKSNSFVRQRGFFVGLLGEVLHIHSIDRTSDAYHSENYAADTLTNLSDHSTNSTRRAFGDVNSIGALAEYHKPVGMHWQFDAMSELLLPLKNGNGAFILHDQAYATFLIDDRWRADFRIQHGRQILKKSSATLYGEANSWWTEAQFGLRYFIEDHVDINFTADQLQTARSFGGFLRGLHDYSPSQTPAFMRDYAFSIGLSYHFIGALEAHGIVPTSTLKPWR